MVGTGQADTAALLIGALRPARVALILTASTRHIETEIGQLLRQIEYAGTTQFDPPDEIVSPQDTKEIYQALKTVLERWPPDGQYAVDVTGGTKPMTVGLAKAAHLFELATLYVGSRFQQVNGQYVRMPGSEHLVDLPDPYTVFGDLDREQARQLYRQHDYSGAARLFRHLARRVKPAQGDRHWGAIAQCYAAWDVFSLRAARSQLADLLRWLDHEDAPRALLAARPTLLRQATLLQQLVALGERVKHGLMLDVLRELDSVLVLLGSLYQNARRREEQHHFDIAALLLYRCLELMSQRRLALYGILTAWPSYAQALSVYPDLEERYARVLRQHGRTRVALPERGISLFTGYALLQAVDDGLSAGINLDVLEQRTAARNDSVLAHGFRLITKDEYQGFRSVVDQILVRFFQVEQGSNRETWLAEHTFIRVT